MYDRDIALYLIDATPDDESAARVTAKINAALKDYPDVTEDFDLLVREIDRAANDSEIGKLLEPYFLDEKNAKTGQLMNEMKVPIHKSDQPSDVNAKRAQAERCKESYDFAIDSYMPCLTLKKTLKLLAVFDKLDAPEVLIMPIATSAFTELNAMTEDERRKTIDMADDKYSETNVLLKLIADARTEPLIIKATGKLWTPPPPDTASEFAWPTEEEAPLTLIAPEPVAPKKKQTNTDDDGSKQ